MTKILAILFANLLMLAVNAQAAYTNYSSVMLGDRAGGMGGAFTALTEDTAASAYYNPAALARLNGSSLSTNVSLFNKYDVAYGSQEQIDEAIFRINKGSILSIPAASGIFSSFRNFSAGLSIVIPDYQVFGGDIYTQGDDTTFLRYDDQSLWVGGAFAFNVSEKQSLGLTVYYTSQSFTRSLTNRYDTGTEIVVLNEEKTYFTNSFVYLLGYYCQLAPAWSFGASYRFHSIPVAGKGSFLQSQVGTVSGAQPLVQSGNIDSDTHIPEKLSFGVAYSRAKDLTVSSDISYFGPNNYRDFDRYGDRIVQKDIVNFAVGFEKYLEPWLALRLGLFTDFSSTPDVPVSPVRRYQDHIDKYGFSANFGIHTTEHTTLTLGGYYLGGTGETAEKVGANYRRMKKTDRVFSFLVGSAFNF